MNTCDYDFTIDYMTLNHPHQHIASVKVEPDFETAVQDALFAGRRCGDLGWSETADTFVIPEWDKEVNEPVISGFSIAMKNGNGHEKQLSKFDISYFRSLATAGSSLLIEKSVMKEGDAFLYRVAGFKREAEIPKKDDDDTLLLLNVSDSKPVHLIVNDCDIAEYMGRSVERRENCEGDFRVFIPDSIFNEIMEICECSGDSENGGILIGHIKRDTRSGDIFLMITAQVPAKHALSASARLKFTPATWTHVRSAIELRQEDETWLGWWHSHPAAKWKADESEIAHENESENQEEQTRILFFSAHDIALHRTVFPAAYSIALVATDIGEGELEFSLYGWRNARIAARGYYEYLSRNNNQAL